MIVPFDKRLRQNQAQLPPLPDEEWAMMAAAQMHSEGRLVQKISDEIETGSWDAQGNRLGGNADFGGKPIPKEKPDLNRPAKDDEIS